MLRPSQHVTDDKGEALLLSTVAPLGWAVNPIKKDYGSDFQIELFRDGKSTGIAFIVQLKSTESPSYSKNNGYVSVRLDTRNARYLSQELHQPVLVIQADVNQNRLYWAAPQTDEALRALLEKKSNARSCSLRVPLENELPATAEKLVEAVGRLTTFLASKRLMEVHSAAFLAATSSLVEGSELSKSLRDKSDALDLMIAQQVTETGDFNSARRTIQAVLSSAQASVESKFFAVLVEERNERLANSAEGGPRSDHVTTVMDAAAKLQALTRSGPPALKYYALLARIAGEFLRLVQEDWGLYQNWKVHQRTGDFWWRAELRALRADIVNRILQKYGQFIRLVKLSEKTSYQSALPLAFLRIVEGAALLISRIELEEIPEGANSIRNSVFAICKLSAAIAMKFGDEKAHALAAVSAGLLSRNREADCVLWANEEIERVSDTANRDWGRTVIAAQHQEVAEEASPDEGVPVSTEQQIYENMATAIGIDPADAENPFSEMVKIGIADLDPTRVLRDCANMFVTLSRRGPSLIYFMLAQWLQLPTMGAKVIHCTLHKYTREGVSLDGAYQRFRQEYCDQCPDRSPREPDWQYSHEWQLGENERNKEFISGPRLPTHKPLPPPPPIPIPGPGSVCASCGLEFAEADVPWWCGSCQTWFCQRKECLNNHTKHPFPY